MFAQLFLNGLNAVPLTFREKTRKVRSYPSPLYFQTYGKLRHENLIPYRRSLFNRRHCQHALFGQCRFILHDKFGVRFLALQ